MCSTAIIRRYKLIALGFVSANAVADQINLKNGDIITGEIVKLDSNKLVVKTNYAGELKIIFSEVLNLASEKPIHIATVNGDKSYGSITINNNEMMTNAVKDSKQLKSIDIAKIAYLNRSLDGLADEFKWSGNINAGSTISEGNS
jgi:ribosomal protein S1